MSSDQHSKTVCRVQKHSQSSSGSPTPSINSKLSYLSSCHDQQSRQHRFIGCCLEQQHPQPTQSPQSSAFDLSLEQPVDNDTSSGRSRTIFTIIMNSVFAVNTMNIILIPLQNCFANSQPKYKSSILGLAER